MPTHAGPNTKGEENLVFGYDLGDVVNSYKGEPVENLQTVDEGNVYTSVSTVNTTAELVDMITPFGNKAWKITIPASGTNGYSSTRAQGPTIQINRDGTYYYHGAWVWMSDDDYVLWEQGNTYVYKYSTGSNGMSSWLLRSALNRKDRAGRIWKAWGAWSYRAEGGTGNQYHTFFKNGTLTRDLVFYIVAPMWGVGKARPVFFANGTRSATQGLIDLTGNSTIDLTNVSFDSNAQMTFDGTNDFADLGTPAELVNLGSSDFTIECVVKPAAVNTGWTGLVYLGRFGESNGHLGFNPSNNVSGGTGDGTTWQTHQTTYTLAAGTWYHLAMTRTSNSIQFYANGTQIGSSFNHPYTPATATANLEIGNGSANEFFNGEIPLAKTYNRALTASEVQSNYNAIKGRFNI